MFKLLLLFLISIFFILPGNISAHSEVQIIEMTKNGFVPSEITVDVNSSVIFINKDKDPRWPASNVHPTHELYPEFDPKHPVGHGESWTFKPKKSGEWKYHDHNFPHMRGVIRVAEENESDSKILERDTKPASNTFAAKFKNAVNNLFTKLKSLFIFKNKSNPQALKQKELPNKEDFKKLSYDIQAKKLEEVSQSNGAAEAWKYINDVFQGEGGTSGNIHDLAHLSGLLLYKSLGFEGIKNCTAQFAFGCYHGFLDKAFAKNLDYLLDAQNACLKLGPANSGPVASCIHGIGHGIASFYATSDLEKALVICRKLSSGNEYCFDGVFMEHVRSAPDSFFQNNDPYYPCDSLEKKYGYAYSFACGRNQPSLLMGRFKMGFDDVIKICANSDSKPFKNACFDSLGFSLASTGNVQQIIQGCKKIGIDEFIAKCIKAAAGELVFQEIPGWQEKSKQVCNGIVSGQSGCLEHVETLIKEYNKQISFNFRNLKSGENVNLYIREQLKICYEANGRDGCYKKAANVLHSQFGFAQTLQVFKENEGFPEVYSRCHEVTHYLSRLEYEKQQSIAKVYAQCDSTCHGGCYHGTLEAYLKEKTNEGINLDNQFAKVCGNKNDYQKPIEFNECLHGMGHAAMFVTEMELKESLKLCDTIAIQEHKERCYTGVFMENSSSSTSFDHASIYIKSDDPFYPCNILEEEYLSLCWQYQSSYFSIINNQDWKKVANLCLQIPSQYQDRCFRTIGTNQVGFTPVLATMKKDCDLMPSEHFKNICVAGVVSSLSYRFVGNTQKMINFCELADSQNKESCFKQIGSGILDWNKNTDLARKECEKIPDPAGQSWCLSVI